MPAPQRESAREPGEDVGPPRSKAAEKVEVAVAERDERHAAVAGRGDDSIGRALPELERTGEASSAGRDVTPDENYAPARGGGGPTGGIFEPPPERASPLIQELELPRRENAEPPGAVVRRRGDKNPGAAGGRGVDPAPCERREEPLPGRAGETLFESFPTGLPGEEDQNARRHAPHLTTRDAARI